MKLSGRDEQLEEKRADVNMHELCINRTNATAGATAVGRGLIWMGEPDGIPSIRTMFK